MIDKQLEALRFDSELDLMCAVESEAAAELRRLHIENKKLKAVLDAARIAMDESTESDDEECSIKIPSHLAASLSLCLDDYDTANKSKEPQ